MSRFFAGHKTTMRPGRSLDVAVTLPPPVEECSGGAADCEQAIEGLYWQDADTGLFTLTEQAGLTKYYDRGLGDGYGQYPWSPDEWVFLAKVVGEICGCEIEWSWNEGDWVYPPVVRFQGNLAIVSAPAESFLGDDVLEISATSCGQSFGPITLTIADEAYA